MGVTLLAAHGIAHAGAPFAVEQELFGQCIRFDAQVFALADWVQIAMSRTHAPTLGDGGLAHRDAILPGAVVVVVVRDADFASGSDQCAVEWVALVRICYA